MLGGVRDPELAALNARLLRMFEKIAFMRCRTRAVTWKPGESNAEDAEGRGGKE